MHPSSLNSEAPMSGNAGSRYIPTHQYTQRLASLSYPDVHYNGYTPPEPIRAGSYRYAEGEFVSAGFFEHLDPMLFDLPKLEIDWTYSLRREAQRILPFLYLGPWSCLSNKQWLRDEGLTLLLGVRDERLARLRLVSGHKAAADLGIESESFDVSSHQDLIARLPHAIRRINDHINPSIYPASGNHIPRKVLIFCETGNGLSALVVVAYLMVMLNMELGGALNLLHSQRFCIDMEDDLRPLLVSFEEILAAKRDVESARMASHQNSTLAAPTMALAKKRSFSDRVEDEPPGYDRMDMEDTSADRKPLAPFQDC
ncbi:dual specificity protein phosphatase family protein [Aspergillus lucknowensis]|uniref:Protein-tyrosine phosphatase-like protein n=1 Tax=Aspergillus lucknowensis TaxID=176173 RepID=A0ABR4M5F3_9EURO